MISISKYFWLPSIKEIYIELERKSNVSPFQQYSFLYNLWKDFLPFALKSKQIPIFFVVRNAEKVVLIAPMCLTSKRILTFFAEVNGVEYCDFVYAMNIDNSPYFRALLEYFKEKSYKLRCGMISEKSVLFQNFSKCDGFIPVKETPYVNIPFGDSYQSYYKSLSSSVRQNIRTSYNRLNRDSKKIELRVLYPNKRMLCFDVPMQQTTTIESKPFQELRLTTVEYDYYFHAMIDVYVQRHNLKYNVRTSSLKKWYLQYINFSTISLKTLPNSINFMIFINEELAAFMSGYENPNDKSYIVPRLSINDKFGFYSPGVLLLNETIKYFISNTPVKNLDLCKGDEAYKFKMGGVTTMVKYFRLY